MSVNIEQKPGVKLIYLIIYHRPDLLIIINLRHVDILFCISVGVVNNKYLSFRFAFTLSNKTSLEYFKNVNLGVLCRILKSNLPFLY